jgi:hypothetical protein
MTDFRELCAELVRAMDSYPLRPKAHRELCNKVRAALDQTPSDPALGHIELKLLAVEAEIKEVRKFIDYIAP